MARDNVETVRHTYAVAFAERSVENVRDVVDESFVWHTRTEWPGRELYRLDEMTQLWADLDDAFADYTIVPEDLAPVGEYVVVRLRTSTRLRASDARLESVLYHVWHLRDGKAREVWAYSTEAEAYETAGLPR